MMKQKREYGRPEMRVVELRQKCGILVGSGEDRSASMTVTYEEEDI